MATRVIVLAADYFEESELIYPVIRLRDEGYDVVVAGLGTGPVRGKSGYGPYPVDAVVVPGGFAPDLLRRSPAVLDLVRTVDAAGKPVAFVCHGGWVAISAGIIRGRRMTGVSAIRDDLVNAGAQWLDEPLVVDGNLISAQLPRDLGPWTRAIVTALS